MNNMPQVEINSASDETGQEIPGVNKKQHKTLHSSDQTQKYATPRRRTPWSFIQQYFYNTILILFVTFFSIYVTLCSERYPFFIKLKSNLL